MKKSTIKGIFIFLWLSNCFLAVLVFGYLISNSSARVLSYYFSPTLSLTYSTTASWAQSSTSTWTIINQDTSTSTPTHTSTISPTVTETSIPFFEGPIVIGTSVESRPLEVYRFGTGGMERLIVAGMHGGSEYNTIQLADELIMYISSHPEVVPENITLYILRNLNPDGEARSHSFLGRANANHVDLNRNWDANWQKDWPRENCWTYTYVTAGSAPASEPETQALMSFILSHNIDAILNYHSAALGIFPGGLPPEEATYRLAEAVSEVSPYPYPPVNVGCVYTGGFTDWADEHGIPALDIELSNHTSIDFEINLQILGVFLSWRP